jgi:hypothetical protein
MIIRVDMIVTDDVESSIHKQEHNPDDTWTDKPMDES